MDNLAPGRSVEEIPHIAARPISYTGSHVPLTSMVAASCGNFRGMRLAGAFFANRAR
jgi:hypothetical protein